jgi:hypothetical protein
MENTNLIESLGNRGEKNLKDNLHPDEKILAKLKGTFGQGFVLTDRHVYIVKWGYMTGNIFGGRCSAFNYSDIVSIETRKNLNTSVLEVLSSATREAPHLSYWSNGDNSALKSNYAVTFFNRDFSKFQQAVVLARDMIHKVHNN